MILNIFQKYYKNWRNNNKMTIGEIRQIIKTELWDLTKRDLLNVLNHIKRLKNNK